MSHILRKTSLGLAFSATVCVAGAAQATVGHAKSIGTPTAGDVTLVVPNGNFSATSVILYPAGGSSSTKNSNTATMKDSGSVFVQDSSSTVNGGAGFNFTSAMFGTQAVETKAGGVAAGPMIITFANPVSEFGFYLRDNSGKNNQSGVFTFTITDTSVSNNTTTLTENFTNTSSSTTLPIFFGAQATSPGIYIKSVTIADSLLTTLSKQDLVIGSIKENTPTIVAAPEPSAAAALGLGALSLVAARLRARRSGPV